MVGMVQAPDIAVVVVSWNCRELLESCLRSVLANTGRMSSEVIVVDNASADGTAEAVRRDFPSVRLIANDANLGFAKANNIAFRSTAARYVLLLNPDAELLQPDTLQRLADYMDRNPDVGAAGCMLLDVDGRWQTSAGYSPSPATIVANSLFLPQLTNNAVKGLCLMRPAANAPESIEVDWVSGACMFVRRRAIDEAGLLDESYFMYGEDIEWAHRIANAGWRITHLPGIRVQHVLAGTRENKHERPVAWLEGLARVYMELEPGRSWLVFKFLVGLGLVLRTLLGAAAAMVSRSTWASRRAAENFALLKSLLGTEAPQAARRS